MYRFSILLVVVSALLFPSFATVHTDTPADVIGTWTSGNSTDAKLRNLTFSFVGEHVEITNEANDVIASGVLKSTQEEIAIATDPFAYEMSMVLQIEITSVSHFSFPTLLRVRSVSSSRMMICYQDGKRSCYTTLKKLSR